MSTFIEVALVVLTNDRGEVLLVRKAGTSKFMNVGGKREPGETWRETAVREVYEEVRVVLDGKVLEPLGVWESQAANEPGLVVRGHAFWWPYALPVEGSGAPRISAEIDRMCWVHPALIDELKEECAPLFLEHCVPFMLSLR